MKREHSKGLSDKVLGMVFILTTEAMFFAGLISAFVVNKAGNVWPPIDQPRLPVEITAVNTIILLLSAVALLMAQRSISGANGATKKTFTWITATAVLGIIFLGIQGYEWVKLIGFGLTSSSSLYGAFFYTIIGIHGFHVLIGMLLLFFLIKSLRQKRESPSQIDDLNFYGMYWYFVVGIWPVLYYLVYLS